jgi:Protein of unknown function (DUF541)
MHRSALLALCLTALPVAAQPTVSPPPNPGTLVIMTGSAEIELPNDEAVVNFFYEAQDADLAKAQALVNQREARRPQGADRDLGLWQLPGLCQRVEPGHCRLARAAGCHAEDRQPRDVAEDGRCRTVDAVGRRR